MDPEEQPTVEPVEHTTDDADEVASRPIGTRSFVYGAKTLAASVVALLLMLFVVIERSTTGGAEVVSHRRVNLDVLLTVALAAFVLMIVAVLQR
jgi:hypothetical protein